MVDQHLLDKLKTIMKHPESTGFDAVVLLFKIFQQLSEENDVLKKMIKDLDLCLQFIIVEGGEDLYKYYCSIRDGKVNHGEGDGTDITTTLRASREIFGGLITREVDVENALKAGDLEILGILQEVLMYGKVLLLVEEIVMGIL